MVDKPQPNPDYSTIIVFDEKAAAARRLYLYRQRALLLCCGCFAAAAVLLGAAALVLALSVLKRKDHVLAMDAAEISDHRHLLIVAISIVNPNVSLLRFNGAVTQFYNGGDSSTVTRSARATSVGGVEVGTWWSAMASAAVAVAMAVAVVGNGEVKAEEVEVIASCMEASIAPTTPTCCRNGGGCGLGLPSLTTLRHSGV